MFIKVKFIKNGSPYGKDYTYRSTVPVSAGDVVELPGRGTGIVTEINVPEESVRAYADKIKEIVGIKDDKDLDESEGK